MDLIFDRGTILLKGPSPEFAFDQFPEFVWDKRVGYFRAPAHEYWSILSKLRQEKREFNDTVCQSRKLTGAWASATLRPYQDAAVQAWTFAGKRGVIALPTGSGKTKVAIEALRQTGVSALCLVPTRILLEQWHQELKSVYDGKIGVYGDSRHELGEITIATYESAYRSMAVLGNRFDLLIVDEAHHFGSGIRDEIFGMAIAAYRLGLTATLPRNRDQLDRLAQSIGPVAYELSIADLSGHFLAEFQLYSLHLEMTEEERRLYEDGIRLFRASYVKFRQSCPEGQWQDFVSVASRSLEGRMALKGLQTAKKAIAFTRAKAKAVSSLLERHRSNRVLVFTADAETAYMLSREHLIAPITSEIGKNERDKTIGWFKEGQLRALVSCRVLNEGFDVSDAEIAIIVGGTHGEREQLQRIGRILRPAAGKKAIVYELICRNTIEVRQSKKRNESIAPRKTASLYD